MYEALDTNKLTILCDAVINRTDRNSRHNQCAADYVNVWMSPNYEWTEGTEWKATVWTFWLILLLSFFKIKVMTYTGMHSYFCSTKLKYGLYAL